MSANPSNQYGPSSYNFRATPSPSHNMLERSSRISSDTSNPSINATVSPSLSQASTMGSIGATSSFRRDRLLKRAARRAQQVADELGGEMMQSQSEGQVNTGYLGGIRSEEASDFGRGLGMSSTSSNNSISGSQTRSITSRGSGGSTSIQDLGVEAELLGVLDEEDLAIPDEEYVGPADLADDIEALGREKKKSSGFRLGKFGRKRSSGILSTTVGKPILGSRQGSSSSKSSSLHSDPSSFRNNPSPSSFTSFPSAQPKPILKSALKISKPSTTLLSDGPLSRDPLLHRGLRRYGSGSTGTSISSSRSASYQPSPLGESRSQTSRTGEGLKSSRCEPLQMNGSERKEIGFLEAMEQAGMSGRTNRPEVNVDPAVLGGAMDHAGTGLGIMGTSTTGVSPKISHTTLPKLNIAFPSGHLPSRSTATNTLPNKLGDLLQHIVHGSVGEVVVKGHVGAAIVRSDEGWTPSLLVLTMNKMGSSGFEAGRATRKLSACLHAFPLDGRDAGSMFGGRTGRLKLENVPSPERSEMARLDVTSGMTLVSKNNADKRVLSLSTEGSNGHADMILHLASESERSEWVLQVQTVIAELSSEGPADRARKLSSPVEMRTPVIGGGLRPAPRPAGLPASALLPPLVPPSGIEAASLLSYDESIALQPASPDPYMGRSRILPRESMSAESIQWNMPIGNMRNSIGSPMTSAIPASPPVRYVDPIDGKTYNLPPSFVGAFMANDNLKNLLAITNNSGETVNLADSIGLGSSRRGSDNSTDSGGEVLATPVAMSVPTLGSIEEDAPRERQAEEREDEELLTPTSERSMGLTRPSVLNRGSSTSFNTLTFGARPGAPPVTPPPPTVDTIELSPVMSATTSAQSLQTLILTPPLPSESSMTPIANASANTPELRSETACQGSRSLNGTTTSWPYSARRRPAWKERARRMKEGGRSGGELAHGEDTEKGLCIMSQLDVIDPTEPPVVTPGPILSRPDLASRSRSLSRDGDAGEGIEGTSEPRAMERKETVVRFAD